jgi:predicted transcriptional regulator
MPFAEPTLRLLHADPRRAIADEHIVCLVCGRALRQLTNTHLRLHGITTADYKARFGYNRGRPLMARTLLRVYAERAVRGGARPIALEERLTRRDVQRRALRCPP